MSRVFEAAITDLSEKTGCSYDFLVDFYNYLVDNGAKTELDNFCSAAEYAFNNI